jgi:hypothetical protein
MSTIRWVASTVAVAAMTAVAAVPAHGAVPFNAGTGHDPQLAVGDDGTGHVVWATAEIGDRVGYCRVPKAGAACDGASRFFSFPNGGVARSVGIMNQVFAPAANKVVVIGSCTMCGFPAGATKRIFRWTSTDNGATFDGPMQIAAGLDPHGQGAYVNAGDMFVGIDGSRVIAGASTPIQPLPGGYVHSPSLVRVSGSDQLVAAASDLHRVEYAAFSGPLSPPHINDVTRWNTPRPAPGGPVNDDESALGSGAGGTFLIYMRIVPGDNRVIVHGYDPATRTFGAPVEIEGRSVIENTSADYPDIAVDDAGPHVIWRSLYDGGRLRYRRSTDGGATWGPVLNIALRDTYIDPQIAVAPSGSGFAVWRGIGTTPIRVVALDPHADPVADYSGPLRRVTVSDRKARYRLSIPRGCLIPGQGFRVRLNWTRLNRAANPFVTVRRAQFRVERRQIKTDRTAPFVRRFVLPDGKAPGSTVELRARAFVKLTRGRSATKSVRTTVMVCP